MLFLYTVSFFYALILAFPPLVTNIVKMALHMSAFIYLMDLIYLNHDILATLF